MNYLQLILIIVLTAVFIYFIMEFFYQKKNQTKIQNYLITCGDLEKEILKSFIKDKDKSFFLTKEAKITKDLLNLNIIFTKEIIFEQKYNSYILNPLVIKLLKQTIN